LFVNERETATNKLKPGDQHTEDQRLTTGVVRLVHVVPFDDVITCAAELSVVEDTATKSANAGDQHTDGQPFSAATSWLVHDVPFADTITFESYSPLATATKIDSSGDQQTDDHWYPSVAVREVHVRPSELVITESLVTAAATATKRLRLGAQQTDCHMRATGPSEDAQAATTPPSASFDVTSNASHVVPLLRSSCFAAVS
jgi:hypothetical protein